MQVPQPERLAALSATVPNSLFATVSGAHLYGFESPDSDIDLRGAFVHPLRRWLGLRRPNETYDRTVVEDGLELDFVAHEVRKSLRLAVTGSGEVLEQIFSPLVVRTTAWHEELVHLARACITRRLHRHYTGFYRSRRALVDSPGATLKHLLYAYRAVLSGIVALRAGRIEAHLPSLLEEHPVDGVSELIERKRSSAEKGLLAASEAAEHAARLDALATELDLVRGKCALPETTEDLRPLDDFLIRVREAHR